MTYYDDILNVNAYLRQKMKNNLEHSKGLCRDYECLDHEIKDLKADADKVLNCAFALAADAGLDISDLAGRQDMENPPTMQMDGLLVCLPTDFDFGKEFERLRAKAHESGFVDVHPEELLSPEEMERARAFEKALDARFAVDTGLTDKDIQIMFLAVAVRVVVYMFVNYVPAAFGEIPDADHLMDSESILHAPTPFDVPDNQSFKRRDVVGFDKYLGFVIGVINFITNTVTTFDFKSYIAENGERSFHQVSTREVLLRVIPNASRLQSQILAAVVREACALGMVHMEPAMAMEMVKRAIELEKAQLNLGWKARGIAKMTPFKESQVRNNVAMTSFINTLVAGIHALQYDPEADGDIEIYAVRTNKILMYSNAMAMTVNSMPAFLSEDVSRVDWGGVLTTCFSLFHSIRFWIDTKTSFWVSAHKKEIDMQIRELDRYFIVE